MQLSINNIDYMIAKKVKTENQTGSVTIAKYKVKKKDNEYKEENYLEITVFGEIGSTEYPIHFIVSKPIEQYLEMQKYESININEDDIIDSYISIDGSFTDLVISRLNITKFPNSLVFNLFFEASDEYYGSVDFEVFIN